MVYTECNHYRMVYHSYSSTHTLSRRPPRRTDTPMFPQCYIYDTSTIHLRYSMILYDTSTIHLCMYVSQVLGNGGGDKESLDLQAATPRIASQWSQVRFNLFYNLGCKPIDNLWLCRRSPRLCRLFRLCELCRLCEAV